MSQNDLSKNLLLRKANESDFSQIKLIYRAPHARPFLCGVTDKDFVDLFQERTRPQNGISGLYVFEEDRQIIATISLEQGRWQFRHVLFIDGIAVKESCQGRGIGHKILEEVEALANQTGVIKRLELLVEEDNPRAIELYTQMGFHEEGRKVGFIKRPEQKHYVDEIVMGKIIG